ncbi:hypothetical protein CONCODRAFT_11225 [Conidiobolus coronatus NRRL 28638]|uniref:Uncharacterized protein n=1 Tax=Conidiobolus coronatus (strain ATCC 28846 / CBS 209.66 / NRRL 28638) TaxID=796925 RepID=A0A137NVJ1_CONC2|nr:hypothetical protein CONCODRAFT_11225 [Conidiobolus coronatus NRRL 28638]|eukprot:KXN66855.1 hypothetical protein CONCODRAFT_11225 [Conidiobolus coronatus NRRL 28638]
MDAFTQTNMALCEAIYGRDREREGKLSNALKRNSVNVYTIPNGPESAQTLSI